MRNKRLSRRVFFTTVSAGFASLVTGLLTSGCAKPAGACSDTSGLAKADVDMRSTLKYVEETPVAEQRCDNCQLYTAADAGASCGGCQVIKGPIAPAGYCISWAAKQM